MQRYALAIVGGGAAGLLAGVRAGERMPGQRVVVLEANQRVGRKLLATGNGRCNLENLQASPACYFGDSRAAAPLLALYPPGRVLAYFQSLGLVCRTLADGRVYPYSNQASSVLNILRKRLAERHVEERCGFPVRGIDRRGEGYLLTAAHGEQLWARRILLAPGGAAQTQAQSGYTLARSLWHTVTPLHPALVPVEVREQRVVRALKGVRIPAAVRLERKGKCLMETRGEVQFTQTALSGICVFEFSRLVRSGDILSLDLVPEYSLSRLEQLTGGSLEGVLPKALYQACPFGEVKHFRFTAAQAGPMRQAQVTAGGVPLREIDARCGSLVSPGVWLCGELLNLDGRCGGFNLHWAWITALAAVEAIAKGDDAE